SKNKSNNKSMNQSKNKSNNKSNKKSNKTSRKGRKDKKDKEGKDKKNKDGKEGTKNFVCGLFCECCIPDPPHCDNKPTKACTARGGTCMDRSGCNTGTHVITDICDDKGSQGCECCSPKPTPTPPPCEQYYRCTDQGGECLNKKTECIGTITKSAKDCLDKDCQCCIPPKPCEQYYRCTDQGGECQDKKTICKGTITKSAKDCIDKHCQCCIPDPCPKGSTCMAKVKGGKCKKKCKGKWQDSGVGCEKYGISNDCKCCKKKQPCEQYYKCVDQGGKCQPKKDKCKGKTTKDCLDKKCRCCIPVDKCPKGSTCMNGKKGKCKKTCKGKWKDKGAGCEKDGYKNTCKCCEKISPG
ncbi:unnamed protein product, partial [Meganyctiphanes norvegica]